jgi:hypothetical protein
MQIVPMSYPFIDYVFLLYTLLFFFSTNTVFLISCENGLLFLSCLDMAGRLVTLEMKRGKAEKPVSVLLPIIS